MVRIHIGLDLENEGAHARLRGLDLAQIAVLRARRRREFAETFEQIADAEIAQRRAEIDRRHVAFAERSEIERLAGFRHQRQLVGDLADVEIGVAPGEFGDVDLFGRTGLGAAAFEQADAAGGNVVGAEEIAAAADRPGHRRGVERQRLFDFVEQFEGVEALAVHLVDEGDDRNVAQTADLDQLPRPRLDALGGVDHHDGGIDRRQRAIGVFRKVLMARRVQQVEDEVVEFERHHRGDDRDAAVALDLHPVGTGVAPFALGLDLPGQIDGAAEQQQFLGQRGLAGVRMRDDGKGAPARHFGGERRAGRRFGSEGEVGHQRACGRETGRNQGDLQEIWSAGRHGCARSRSTSYRDQRGRPPIHHHYAQGRPCWPEAVPWRGCCC